MSIRSYAHRRHSLVLGRKAKLVVYILVIAISLVAMIIA